MRLAGLSVALLALVASVPAALAGSEDAPDVSSPRDREEARADLLAVWLEPDPRGFIVVFKAASVGPRESNLVYWLTLEVDGKRHAPTVGFDGDGRARTDSGTNRAGWSRGDVDDALLLMKTERGSPAYLRALVPWGLYGLEPGSEVRPVTASSAFCCTERGDRWVAPYDEARADRVTYIATGGALTPKTRDLFPILVPAWVIPTIVVACLAGGLGGGYALARATARPAAPRTDAAPPRAIERPAPRPPGQRFQRAPPR